MRKVEEIVINGRSLADILEEHKLWLSEPVGEETHNKANLREADLRWANLSDSNLSLANLREADLSGANFSYANLSVANLSYANLIQADLSVANLSYANLSGANLSYANLRGANLRGANLSYANLRGANLRGADIDYSCWPLWCGSKNVKVDARIAAQLAAHFCVLDCDDPAYIATREAILGFSKTSHRANDLGLL